MTMTPIIDSHIHLYDQPSLSRLAWTSSLPAFHTLNRQHVVRDYRDAVSGSSSVVTSSSAHAVANANAPPQHKYRLAGFIFVETDRISGLEDSEWEDAIQEAEFLARISAGKHVGGEEQQEEAKLLLGVVAWAPIPRGRQGLQRYMNRLWKITPSEHQPHQPAQQQQQQQQQQRTGRHLIKGVRYLLQDKPRGTMLQAGFIDGLKWLGEQNLTFDLGVDARQGGLEQLEEAVEMMGQVFGEIDDEGEGKKENKVTIVVNHFCKPNLRLEETGSAGAGAGAGVESHEDFIRWKTGIEAIARWPTTYMKLSGLFSELPPQEEAQQDANLDELVSKILPWAQVVFTAFGPSRIMFGSDWPVCNVGGPGPLRTWSHWQRVVEAVLGELCVAMTTTTTTTTTKEDVQRRIWHGTAAEAYGISESSYL